MVRSARIHQLVKGAGLFGTRTGEVALDWDAIVRRQHEVVRVLQPSPDAFEKAGAKVHLAAARFVDPHTVQVNGQRIQGEKIVIAAGSEPVLPPVPGRELTITSDQILFLPRFPHTLTLIGAGVIGLEMAGAFADLGARVTVVGKDAEILPTLDADVAAYIRQLLEAKGVTFHLRAIVERFSGGPGAVVTHVQTEAGPLAFEAEQVCVAVGRRFDPRRLGAEALGLEVGPLGLKVTPYLRTPVPHIYAAGDAAGNQQMTPTAAYEGRLAALNALRGDVEAADYAVVPQTIFTTPEVGRVGLTHAEARRRGVNCHVATHDLRGASNGRATGEDAGYLKLVFDGTTETVLGVQMVSYAAAELIQLAALAIRTRADARLLSSQLSIHPSHGERLIKIFGHDYHEVCEPEQPPAR
ncbi:MAG: NAD(P)/FAD-dependent oxidoreductase [Candidatus Rokubacteria bacterium]|nr:NAD(P)/FAD-dependent oxidoreductase [Candidatus Rokubacteria bacterium]